MPFPKNPDFVGRTDDLERLHATLQQREPVGIRPAGLTGMGGIGKTQLAVEYVYRFKDAYPHGIFWINAAEPLAKGLAQIGSRLRPQVLERPPDEQLRAAFDELKRRPGALVVFDNLEDPAQLARPVGAEASPLTLSCRILFTTRQRELGRFQPIEVSVLPEGPALQWLLRDDSRHPVRDDRHHPERSEARAICRMLGFLPLALELASAFLAEWSEVSLADYRKRLGEEGCLPTLDSEVANLAAVNFQPIHEAAVAATLKTQWEALRPGDETARLVFRVAGQFTEAAAIPVATLGLFAGVSLAGRPGNPSLLQRALKRLHDVRLIEELHEKRIRLHPLVREFARSLTPEAEAPEFRHACARRCRGIRGFRHARKHRPGRGCGSRAAGARSPHWSSPQRHSTRPGAPWRRCSAALLAKPITCGTGIASTSRGASPSSSCSGRRPWGNGSWPTERSIGSRRLPAHIWCSAGEPTANPPPS